MQSEILDETYKIRISPRKLRSGKYQVKFFAVVDSQNVYGYLLANQKETLRTVIGRIKCNLHRMDSNFLYDHSRFIEIKKTAHTHSECMIFNYVNS